MVGVPLRIILHPRTLDAVPHYSYTCYVDKPPSEIRAAIAENVFGEVNGNVHVARVYRPVSNGRLPTVTQFELLDTCTKVTYSDGCIVYSYVSDNQAEPEHRGLDRYSDEDMFMLDDSMIM